MEYVPITSLSPSLPLPASKSLRAIVTLIWPYSSSTQQCALLVSEPDFRLRHHRGQIRVHFSGASAEAVAKSRVGIGDEIHIGLEGARWEEDQSRIHTPGKSVDGELLFRGRLKLEILREGHMEVIDVDQQDIPKIRDITRDEFITPRREAVGHAFQFTRGPLSQPLIYASPAFSKRLRLSTDSLLDSSFASFLDDDRQLSKKPRRSFGLIKEWRYADRSPSPVSSEISTNDRIPGFAEQSTVPTLDVSDNGPHVEAQSDDSGHPIGNGSQVASLTTNALGNDNELSPADPDEPISNTEDIVQASTPQSLPNDEHTTDQVVPAPSALPDQDVVMLDSGGHGLSHESAFSEPFRDPSDLHSTPQSSLPDARGSPISDPTTINANYLNNNHNAVEPIPPSTFDTTSEVEPSEEMTGTERFTPTFPEEANSNSGLHMYHPEVSANDESAPQFTSGSVEDVPELGNRVFDEPPSPIPDYEHDYENDPGLQTSALELEEASTPRKESPEFERTSDSVAKTDPPAGVQSFISEAVETSAANDPLIKDDQENPAVAELLPQDLDETLPSPAFMMSTPASSGPKPTLVGDGTPEVAHRRVMSHTFSSLFGFTDLAPASPTMSSSVPLQPQPPIDFDGLFSQTVASDAPDGMSIDQSGVDVETTSEIVDSMLEDTQDFPTTGNPFPSPQPFGNLENNDDLDQMLGDTSGVKTTSVDDFVMEASNLHAVPAKFDNLDPLVVPGSEPTPEDDAADIMIAHTPPAAEENNVPPQQPPFEQAALHDFELTEALLRRSSEFVVSYDSNLGSIAPEVNRSALQHDDAAVLPEAMQVKPADTQTSSQTSPVHGRMATDLVQDESDLMLANADSPAVFSDQSSSQVMQDTTPRAGISYSSIETPAIESGLILRRVSYQDLDQAADYIDGNLDLVGDGDISVDCEEDDTTTNDAASLFAGNDKETTAEAVYDTSERKDLNSLAFNSDEAHGVLETTSASGNDAMLEGTAEMVELSVPQTDIETVMEDAAVLTDSPVVQETLEVTPAVKLAPSPVSPITFPDVVETVEEHPIINTDDDQDGVEATLYLADSTQNTMLSDILPIASRTRSRLSILEVDMVENADRRSPRKMTDEELIAEQLMSEQESSEVNPESTNATMEPPQSQIEPQATSSAPFAFSSAASQSVSTHQTSLQTPATAFSTPRRLRRKSQMTPSTSAATPLSGRLSRLPNAISAWFSPRGTASQTAHIANKSLFDETLLADEIGVDETARFELLSQPLNTPLAYFTPLDQLSRKVNIPTTNAYGSNFIDVIAIVSDESSNPTRAKDGPKDFYTVFHVLDPSLKDGASIRVEVYRPWKAKLPRAARGDAVLIRAFALKSRDHQPYLLSTDTSAYCVWRLPAFEKSSSVSHERLDAFTRVKTEVRGPPVEYGEEESNRAKALREWWEHMQSSNDS